MPEPRTILLYGDVDLRYTDGSAVWLTSIARALSATNSRVTLLLKSARGTGGLFDDLARIENLEILDDFTAKVVRGPRYRPLMAAQRIDALVEERGFDIVVCRGFEICKAVSNQPLAGPRLWAYMTDIPQSAQDMTDEATADLTAIATTARRIFAQTDEAREFLEYHVPAVRKRTILLPPMIPDDLPASTPDLDPEAPEVNARPISLVYAGKFARRWNTLEMCELPRRAAEFGIEVHLTMIGDKFQNDPEDTSWSDRMRQAIESSEGVRWLGRLSREETLHEIARHDAGLAWRDPELDASHEISTKLLEYMASGVPPLVNRTVMHETLLGTGYPLFINDGKILAGLERLAEIGPARLELQRRIRDAVAAYRLPARANSLEADFVSAEEDTDRDASHRPLLVEIAASEINTVLTEATLGACRGVLAMRLGGDSASLPEGHSSILVTDSDHLSSLPDHDRPVWLIWDDRNAAVPRPGGVAFAGVLVSDTASRRQAAWWANVPASQVFALPESTDMTAARPKNPCAAFTVGLLIEGDYDRSVRDARSLLTQLRAEDERFTLRLFLVGTDLQSANAQERELLADAFEDLARDQQTAGAWSIADLSSNATWLREVGHLVGSHQTTIQRMLGRTPLIANSHIAGSLLGRLGSDAGENAENPSIEAIATSIVHFDGDSREEAKSARRDSIHVSRDAQRDELARLLRAAHSQSPRFADSGTKKEL